MSENSTGDNFSSEYNETILGCINGELSVSSIILACLLALLVVSTILANAFVVATITLVNSVRIAPNYLVASLAASDILVAVCVMPLAAMRDVYGTWTLGPTACQIFVILDVTCCTASILNIIVIAIDRYLAINQPIKYLSRRTVKWITFLIVSVWVLSFSTSLPPFFGWATEQPGPCYCQISQDFGYTVFSTVVAFYVPLFLLIFLYVQIYRALKRSTRKIANSHNPNIIAAVSRLETARTSVPYNTTPPNSPNEINGRLAISNRANATFPPIDAEPSQPSRRSSNICLHKVGQRPSNSSRRSSRLPGISLSKERKFVTTLGVIIVVFCVCWCPFFIVAVTMPFCETCEIHPTLSLVVNWLGYINSVLNPICYAMFNAELRKAFTILLFSKRVFCRDE